MRLLWLLLGLLSYRIECLHETSNSSLNAANSTHEKLAVPLPWLENLVKLKAPKRIRNNSTEDEIITDEDVADIPDDDKHTKINSMIQEGDKTTITISSEAGEELYQHWLDQAVSGLMATVATNQLDKVTKEDKIAHKNCAKSAKTVTAHAKCVAALLIAAEMDKHRTTTSPSTSTLSIKSTTISALTSNSTKADGTKVSKTQSTGKFHSLEKNAVKKNFPSTSRKFPTPIHSERFERLRNKNSTEKSPKRISFRHNSFQKKSSSSEMKFRRLKRDIGGFKPVTKDTYTITDVRGKSPFSIMAKQLTDAVRAFKNKDRQLKSWQETLDEIAEEGKLLKKKEKVKKLLKKRMQIFTRVMHDAGVDAPEALDAVSLDDDETELSSREELRREAKEAEEKLSPEDKALREPIKLIRQAVKLGLMLKGDDVSDFDNKTLKMVSPRIMPLLPDEMDKDNGTVNLFSPNLFSLHNETSEHDVLNLARLMSHIGGGKESTQDWMNFVFEASGVADAVSYMKAERLKADKEEAMKKFRDKDGKQQYFNKDNITEIYGQEGREAVDHIEQLHAMFSQDQFDKLNTTGYVSMTPDQLEFLYGEDSPYNNTEALENFRNITEEDQHEAIKSAIHSMAKEELKFKVQRRKDVVLSPVLFASFVNNPVGASQAIVLSPILFTPLITSPAIFGSVILSPWAFVPVIVSPRILGPIVLSPILFSPIILSPLAMVPIILSPGVGVPLVLSPFVLSPFILSPVVLTPVILSPFALSPFILVPNLLSPLILSPFVLSPLVLSPPFITAFILNPYALSPIIKSDGFAFTAVFSPSWLS